MHPHFLGLKETDTQPCSPTLSLTECSKGRLRVVSVQGPHHKAGEAQEDPEIQVRLHKWIEASG